MTISLQDVTMPDMGGRTVQGYLDRIGFEGEPKADFETLCKLQKAHIYSVPYENVDIRAGKYVSVHLPDIYDKVVKKRRGGYCFELNGLFSWLLRCIGFEVTEYYGRYLLGEPVPVPMRRHRICCVRLDGKDYLVDVGVGVKAPVYPLLFEENTVQVQDGEEFRLVFHPVLRWCVEGIYKGKWDRLYSFTRDDQYQVDFEMPNHWCVTHPDSIFKNMTMLFIRTPEGRNTAVDIVDENGNPQIEFRRFTKDGLIKTITSNEEEYKAALLTHFGIKV